MSAHSQGGPDAANARVGVSAGGPENLTALATRRPVAVLMVTMAVITFGFISFDRLPQSLMPDISYPSITVRSEYAGASPLDVETRVSRRLEESLAQVRNLRRVSSISRAEAADVVLEFDWDTDMSLATMDVRERVEQTILPDDVGRPTILRYDPSLDPILQLGIYRRAEGETMRPTSEQGLIALRILAEDQVERALEGISGVAAVQVRGGLEREIRIDVDEARLRATGITMALIGQRLAEENLNQASGILYEGDQSFVVRTVNEFQDVEQIGRLIVKREGTVPVRLDEIARVTSSYAEPEVLTRINGYPCVKLDIFKEADSNLVETAGRVRDAVFGTAAERALLERLERQEQERLASAGADAGADAEDGTRSGGGASEAESGSNGGAVGGRNDAAGPGGAPSRPRFLASRLPPDVALEVMSDQSEFIERALREVRQTAIAGGLLAIAVLYLFLRNAWFTLAVGLSIPVSIIASFTPLQISGVSLNMMSLGGLALGIGMLVDTSIVVLESVFRCQEEGDPPMRAAVRGTRQVAGAVVASTLTTVCVFFPIVFVEGVAGQVFQDQALAVVISLVASLLVSLYMLPALICRRPSLGGRRASGEAAGPAGRPRLFRSHRDLAARVRGLARAFRRGGILLGLGLVVVTPLLIPLFLVLFVLSFALELVRLCLITMLWLVFSIFRLLLRLVELVFGGGVKGVFGIWDRAFAGVQAAYALLLRGALANRGVVLLVVAACAAGSVWCFAQLGSELIPEVHQGEFTAEVRLPIGTRVERTDEVLRPLEERILGERDALAIASLTTTVGVEKDSIDFGDEGEHTAKLLARLRHGRNPRRFEEEAKSRMREILRDEPELAALKFENPVLFTFKTPIEVEVRGYNLAELRRITREIESAMNRLPALKDVKSNVNSGYPEAHLQFDRELLSRYGLTVASVGQVIREMIQGDVPSYFSEGDRKVDIRVRAEEEDRDSLEKLADLVINPDAPAPLKLRDLLLDGGGPIEVSEGPAEIRRIGQQRAGVVTANLTGLDLGNVVEQIQSVIERIERPLTFSIQFGGQKEEMDASRDSLLRALLLAIFLVYVVMAVQFESLVQPFVIISAVPLAMVGVSPLLWALQMPLNIVVFIGMIVLAGIVVNNAIVLVSYVNQLRARAMPLAEALVAAGSVRLRPILMTTITTVLGLVPLTGALDGIPALASVLGVGEGAEVRAPLAITVIAGLIASTALTLVVVPVLYSLIVGGFRRNERPGDTGGEVLDAI